MTLATLKRAGAQVPGVRAVYLSPVDLPSGIEPSRGISGVFQVLREVGLTCTSRDGQYYRVGHVEDVLVAIAALEVMASEFSP